MNAASLCTVYSSTPPHDIVAFLCHARYGHERAVATLLAAGAEKNPLDGAGQTPMSRAATSGHARVVRLFYI